MIHKFKQILNKLYFMINKNQMKMITQNQEKPSDLTNLIYLT